ncbi:hypothetical protein [Arthrobacter ulcerisalmonis]|uniref:hypothetical protein n=1 Tax=Arthrobacter ulcerisalmonis TaxID=2483813 RepID=UPI00363B8985
MSFKAVVASSTVRLSASEERAMNVLMSGDMAGIPAAEVAERAKTHESTVVRLAKNLATEDTRSFARTSGATKRR